MAEWEIEAHGKSDKSFFVFGPNGFELEVNCPDIPRADQEAIAAQMVTTLNAHPAPPQTGGRGGKCDESTGAGSPP